MFLPDELSVLTNFSRIFNNLIEFLVSLFV
jgi:hypothetical protein